MKNIAFFLGGFAGGGIGRVVSILVNKMAENSNYNIKLFLVSPPQKSEIYEINNNIKRKYLLDSYSSMKKVLPSITCKLHKELKKEKIDVLIACGNVLYLPSILATKFTTSKVICWEHSNVYNTKDNDAQTLNRWFATLFSNCIVTLTDCDKNGFKQRFNAKRIKRIYNPVDPTLKNVNRIYQNVSKKIVSVGRLCYQKYFEIIPLIAHDLFIKHPDWSWDIYGSGEEQEKLQKQIDELELSEKVILKGQANNLYDLYNQYAFVVMTSRYEGFPMTLLECSAKGLPMISFDIKTGPNEIIKNGINGFLIAPFDTKDMGKKIESLICSEKSREKMSKESYETSQLFSAGEIVKQWFELFNALE